MSILDLYRMVDPNFMPDIAVSAGQLFIREAEKKLAMVAGVVLLPEGLETESIYPVKIEIHLPGREDMREQAKGQSLDSILTSSIWRVKKDGKYTR